MLQNTHQPIRSLPRSRSERNLMIDSLEIENFRCFEKLASLTTLALSTSTRESDRARQLYCWKQYLWGWVVVRTFPYATGHGVGWEVSSAYQ